VGARQFWWCHREQELPNSDVVESDTPYQTSQEFVFLSHSNLNEPDSFVVILREKLFFSATEVTLLDNPNVSNALGFWQLLYLVPSKNLNIN
jgi:hypothetical protein